MYVQSCSAAIMQANYGTSHATFFSLLLLVDFLFLAVLLLGIRRIYLCWSFSLLFYKYTFSVGRMQSWTVAERDLMTIRTSCTFLRALLFGRLRFYRHVVQQLRSQGPHFEWQLQSFIRYRVEGTTVVSNDCVAIQNFNMVVSAYGNWIILHACIFVY